MKNLMLWIMALLMPSWCFAATPISHTSATEKDPFYIAPIKMPPPIVITGDYVPLLTAPILAQSRSLTVIDNRFQGYNYNKPIERKFPPASRMGTLTLLYFPPLGNTRERFVEISHQRFPLSPGFKLRNADNLIVLPTSITVPQEVAYLAPNGIVNKIWILREEERNNFQNYLFK